MSLQAVRRHLRRAGALQSAVCTGARKHTVEGKPDKAHVPTSYVERQNLTMRSHSTSRSITSCASIRR